jgi:hypothetical protein
MFSGRGLHVVWLHDCLPKQALPRWQAVQRQLRESLQRLGADPNACDAARVFRLAGTCNSKSGEMVRQRQARKTHSGRPARVETRTPTGTRCWKSWTASWPIAGRTAFRRAAATP